MTTLVFSALTILCFLYAVNLYLEGKMTDVIGGVIGMLITADIILAFFLNKWWYGLIAVLLMFVLIAFLRPFGNFIASKLLGKRIPYNVKTSNSSHYLRKTLNGNGDWNKAMELVRKENVEIKKKLMIIYNNPNILEIVNEFELSFEDFEEIFFETRLILQGLAWEIFQTPKELRILLELKKRKASEDEILKNFKYIY